MSTKAHQSKMLSEVKTIFILNPVKKGERTAAKTLNGGLGQKGTFDQII